MVSFQLEGQRFSAISAGPYFQFNPSISFMVECSTEEEVDKKYEALSEGGLDLMPLGEYPFSKRTNLWTYAGYADGAKGWKNEADVNYNGWQVGLGLLHKF